MPSLITLDHYTITTGHLRESPRAEVTIPLDMLADQLTTGVHPMPNFEGYSVRSTVAGTMLAATVFYGPAPLVTALCVVDAAGLAEALRLTGARPPRRLEAPACLVTVHPTIMAAPDAQSWIGDWERCLAWAWVEKMG
jgi:hypothetical protein